MEEEAVKKYRKLKGNSSATLRDVIADERGWPALFWANMPLGNDRSLTHQQAFDVAAYLNLQYRPSDPRESKLLKLLEDLLP